MEKKIAVLIPTFKPGWYLKRCLESLDNQSISKDLFKVYIALNGPKENFEKTVINAINATNLDCNYYYIESPGVSYARNFLIDKSSEEFIVFIDDDDLVSKKYLEDLYLASSRTCMGISMTYNFESELTDLKCNFIGKSFDKLDKKERSKYKSRKYFSSPWAKMLHKEMIGKIRFDTNLSKGEDALFMAKISKNIELTQKAENDCSYFVYERHGSATRKKNSLANEIARTWYLLIAYSKMAISGEYSKLFIATRVAATLKNMRLF